ncbi:glycoside hydrolase family 3 C-terminal domain-containing protein [Humibacter antri]
MTVPHRTLQSLLAELTLEEKVGLLTGRDFWSTVPIERIGLRSMVFSDGPAGVRGPVWDERDPSLSLPSATALAASWDPELAERYGQAVATEAVRKGVDVVLGPTVNLHRTPIGGRTFEAFSEDPLLTGVLGAAYVRGLQRNGVAASPKHYVANDSETERFTVDVRVDERALRELYLAPFERIVAEAGAWTVMSAYNGVNGATMTENELLENPLKSEWGFDGVVVSDWTGVRSLDAAAAGQDLAMPGPRGPWGAALVEAVRDGRIAAQAIDDKVLRMLALAQRVGALAPSTASGIKTRTTATVRSADADRADLESAASDSAAFDGAVVDGAAFAGAAFAREAAAAGIVLLRNEGELPWTPERGIRSIAVIGQNARDARIQGGGSTTVLPERVVSPLEAVERAFPAARVDYAPGALINEGIQPLPLAEMTDPVTGEPGVVVEFLDAAGEITYTEHRRSTALVYFGGAAPIASSAGLRLRLTYTPPTTGCLRFGYASSRPTTIRVAGELIVDDVPPVVPFGDLGASFAVSDSAVGSVAVVAGRPVEIVVEYDLAAGGGVPGNALQATFGLAPMADDPERLIAEAVEAAAAADVVLVVAGTNSRVESEGFDRTGLALPGRQDEVVAAVAAVNPHTVVVVNSGAPVAMPWRSRVAAIVHGHFGGQEFGAAVSDVLCGAVEPGGRLATTWPAQLEDAPVSHVTPEAGLLDYAEGIAIGYRAWLGHDTEPAYPFGHGLGYTTWSLDAVTTATREAEASVAVRLTNTGERSGKQVVQVYASRRDSAVVRPERWLVGFATVHAQPGASETADVVVRKRDLAYWSGDGGWAYEPGAYELSVGTSVIELPLRAALYLADDGEFAA